MKRYLFFISAGVLLCTTNCSAPEENNDPVLGVWAIEATISPESASKQTERQEWIFNDAFLGRYHTFQNKNLEIITDFGWKREHEIYTITYPGTNFPDDIVTLQDTPEGVILEDINGVTLAIKE